ncbi:hypothetical protein CDD81_2253 [Ophiocordyceps australis]|uniref:Fumarylacetoacetase-like C-terminal domain-containing protein n=1 Tax=Ophiocordyceps australis TaxID=1399860 RepID=A0A2C5YCX5_9HYPO|nr:hypothetical protein CDD81_2253 [Ophiocordyceps australis]
MASFSRLVRFLAQNGRTYYGDAILPPGVTDVAKSCQARIITGDIFGKHDVLDQVVDIQRLLPPLAPRDAGTVRCLGLNYKDHALETKNRPPAYPVLFYKPPTALTGPADPIPVSAMAQERPGIDYECELVVVIGKQCINVSEAQALDFVLGYAVGNDVSHRGWQMLPDGGQWSHGKGFDGWAPYGPAIVSTNVIKDPQNLAIWTKIDGQTVQHGSTENMIFSVRQIVSLLSRGVTLMPGDLIFTGTPAGVAMGRKPQLWLKDGDIVQVGLEKVGTCTNQIDFAKPKPKM